MCSVNTTMFSQYKDVPCLPAPEFMSNLTKMKFAKIADIRENEFECVFGNVFNAKSRHCFHILFYTRYAYDYQNFFCIDKTCGDIYLISYDEDHTEGSTYAIRKSKKYSYAYFFEYIKKNDRYLPGIDSLFNSISSYNWMNYLNVTYKQPYSERGLLIKKENVDTVDFIYFNVGEGTAFCSCSKSAYENWKTIRTNVIDDFLYSSEIAKISTYGNGIKNEIIFNRKLSKLVGELMDVIINTKFDFGNLSIIMVVNGVYVRLQQNVYSKEIDDYFLKIRTYLN